MATYREEEDPFEEDIVFDQAGLLNSSSKMNTAIRRVSSGKCVLFAKTLGLCGAFFGLGLCFAIPGPTLSPLTEMESSLSPVSNIYVARTCGYVVGSIIGGVLFDRFNRLFLLFLSLLLAAIFITVTPWCQALWILESCMILLGITMGFLDTGGNVLCLDLWGRNSGPFMQALHFSFGLGAFVAPLLAAPFLEPALANSTLSTEFSHAFTEFPVHLEDSKAILYHEERFRREIESMKDFSDGGDEISKNISNNSLFPDNNTNVSDVAVSSASFGESSTLLSDVHSESFSSSTPSTSAKPRKLKPSKIDASKLGTKNWDGVHVGIPPASDLLPLTTSSVPTPSPPPLQSTTATTTIPSEKSLVNATTESSSVLVDVSTTATTPISTSTEISLNNLSTISSGTTEISLSISSKLPNSFPDLNEKLLTKSTSTASSPPSVLFESPKALSSIHSLQDPAIDEIPFSNNNNDNNMHSIKDSTTEIIKEISSGKEKIDTDDNNDDGDDDDEILPHRILPYENSSEKVAAAVAADPSRVTSEKMDRNISRKNSWVNSLQLKLDSQNFSLPVPGPLRSKEESVESLQHAIPESPFRHLSVEKAVVYNSKDPLSDNVNYENTTPASSLKNTWLNQNATGSMEDDPTRPDDDFGQKPNDDFGQKPNDDFGQKPNDDFGQKPNDDFGQKPNDEIIALQKNEIATTLNSGSIITKFLEEDNIVSTNPLGTVNVVSTSVPILGHSHHVHHKPGTFDNDTEHINTIFDMIANRIEKYGFNKIQFTYLIVGIFVFLISLVFLGFLCHNPRDPKSKQEGLGGKKITNKVVHKLLVSLMAFFFFLYMGLGVTYGQLDLAFSTHSNLRLSVVFWGSFAAMRFASIFFASGFSPLTMLMLNFAFCTTGTILVSFFANHFETALWIGTALIGIGLASMFPTGILWIERYIHVSNKVAAVFVIGVALGELICPVIINDLLVIDRMLFMYAVLVINIICILIFTLLWWLASRQGEKYSVINNNGYQLANQHDEEEDMMDMSPSGSGVLPRRHCFSSEHRALLNGNLHRGP